MFTITPNQKWKSFATLFGKDILKRYNWFLFEYGKRLSYLVHDHLLGSISQMKGSDDYKKRLVIGEMRDRGNRAWWAIAARAQRLGEGNLDPKTTIFTVISKQKGDHEDPVEQVLEAFEPWSVDTIPFVPSPRQAHVIAQTVTAEKVEKVRQQNLADMHKIRAAMEELGVEFDSRQTIWSKLNVVSDLEESAIRQEFGLDADSLTHWRPAIRYAKTGAIRKLQADTDLIRAMTDPKFMGWKKRQHEKVILTRREIEALKKFQDKVRV